MRLTLPIAIHYTIKNHNFIKNKISIDEIEKKIDIYTGCAKKKKDILNISVKLQIINIFF